MDLGCEHSIDRISNLPDAVLCHILSFLPTKVVVGTSILSRRWRYVWASIPNLDFYDYGFHPSWWDKDLERAMSFVNFVNRVLLLKDVSHIEKFRLQCGEYFHHLVHTWICSVIKCNIREFNLSFDMEEPVTLPHMLFTCETLVFLRLHYGISLDIPTLVWLPSLKTLHLSLVVYVNDDAIQKFLCGCPVLEEFFIIREQDDQWDFNVSSPTLKRLTVDFVQESLDKREYKFVINAPNLVYFKLDDIYSQDFLVENLSSLVKADINVLEESSRPYGERTYKLLNGISNFEFLSLSNNTLWSLVLGDGYNLPTFYNLTYLEVDLDCDSRWELLTDFLESSPNLEVLILKQEDLNAEPGEHWTPPLCVPNCLEFHLVEIEIKEFLGFEYELEAIEYILGNAKVSKKMTINCQCLRNKEKAPSVCEKLSTFPRGSMSCQLGILFRESWSRSSLFVRMSSFI